MRASAFARLTIGAACFAGLQAPSAALGQDHVVPHSENIPCVLWTRGCTPTSASMVLGYWDRGDANWEWYGLGRLIDYWREYSYKSDGTGPLRNVPNILEELRLDLGTDVNGGTWPSDISAGIESTTNTRHGYGFSSEQTVCQLFSFGPGTDWCWGKIRSEIDGGRPFVWSVGIDNQAGHSLAAWGYTDAKYVITYNTWQCPGRDDWYYSQFDNDSSIGWGYVNTVVPGGWTWGQTSLTSPNGGETWVASGTYSIAWYESDDRTYSADLFYSLDGGAGWTFITRVQPSSPGSKSYAWKIPSTVTATTKARVRIENYSASAGNWVYQAGDGSEANFAIVKPNLTLTAPNGGERWFAGETRNITWTSAYAGSYVKIELSRDAGATWSVLAGSALNTGSYAWVVSGPDATSCRVRITSTSYPDGTDTSGASFTIGHLTVTSPNGGETLYGGETKAVTWTQSNAGSYVRVELSRDAGATWSVLAGSAPNTGSYPWAVGGRASTTCRIRVTSTSYPAATDASDADFAIVPAATASFNGDVFPDLLWHHQVTGELYAWLLQGTVTTAGSYLTPSRFADTNWQIRALADFNGNRSTDVLWHNQVTGELYVWFLQGTVTTAGAYLTPSRFADTNWQIRGSADFDGDGKRDLLWHNQLSGDLYVWFMSGTVVASGTYLTPSRFADTQWQIRGLADFNLDGQPDILWHHRGTGDLYVWGMTGTAVSWGSYLTPSRFADTQWKIVSVADFDQDGNQDLLWHHQGTGDLYVWFLSGTVVTRGSYLTPSRFADTSWKVVPR